MTQPVRIQRRRTPGFDLQAASRAINGLEAIYVGRPTKWGNPFVVVREHNRQRRKPGGAIVSTPAEAVRAYRRFIAHEVRIQEEAAQELRGKNLACWCPLDRPCHADVLLRIANE